MGPARAGATGCRAGVGHDVETRACFPTGACSRSKGINLRGVRHRRTTDARLWTLVSTFVSSVGAYVNRFESTLGLVNGAKSSNCNR